MLSERRLHIQRAHTATTQSSVAKITAASGCPRRAHHAPDDAVPHAGGFTVGHVMVLPEHTEHALLPMPAAELVTDDRVAVQAGLDVGSL